MIWTSGHRPGFGWIHLPAFDDMGFPVPTEGRTSVAGLHFAGGHCQRKSQSATLYGVDEDSRLVAEHIVGNRA